MQLTTKLLFMFCWHVPWWECKTIRVDISSAIPVDQLQGWLSVRFFYMLYYTRLGVGVVANNNRLVMNWYSFLGHEYSYFNGFVSHLIALKTLESQNIFEALLPEASPGLCLRPHLGLYSPPFPF